MMKLRIKNIVFRDIFIYFSIAIIVCLAAILFITSSSYWIIRYHDIAESHLQVENSLQSQTRKVSTLTRGYATGNLVYANVVAHPDEKWFVENIGHDLRENFNIDFAAVYDSNGEIIFLNTQNKHLREDIQDFQVTFRQLIKELRNNSPQNVFQKIISHGNNLYISSIAKISPLDSFTETNKGNPFYLILLEAMDDVFFQEMSKTFMIDGLRYINRQSLLSLKNIQYLPLKIDNQIQGYLTWLPKNTAQSVLSSLLPTGICVTLLLCVIGIFLIRNITNAALSYEEVLNKLVRTSEKLNESKEIAEKSSRAKTKFLATMSHEIRTPMNGIIGMISLLKETRLNGVQVSYVDTIQLSADALTSMISSILDYSKLETGQNELFLTPVNIQILAMEIHRLLLPVALQKKLKFDIIFHDVMPEKVSTDPVRLRQILLNLTTNALKFTQKGKVDITVSMTPIVDSQTDITFEIIDTGVGLSAANQEALLEDFIQVDSSLNRNFDKGGLGLILVKNLLSLMGGKMGLESKLGQGSIFWFTIPVKIDDIQN